MAVYTKLTQAEIGEFLANYALGKFSSAKGIEEGIENTNYLVTVGGKPYILTLFEKRVTAKDLPFFMALTEWLSERGIPCPKPVKDKDGHSLGTLKGKPAALIQFLEGKGKPNLTHYHMEQLGGLMAAMHLAAQDFPESRANDLSLVGWHELHQKIGRSADKISAGLSDIIARELEYLDKHWPKNLPAGVVHADMFPDNVFFKQDQLSGVIDFYFACHDFWMYDVMIAVNAWCFNGSHAFVPARARILLQHYHVARPIWPEERAAMQILGRGAALRFLLTRTHDWLNRVDGALVVPKDPLEYLTKLQFFQKHNPLSPL